MGDQSAIEWTDATWNCLVGCSRVSEGCRHCYAERQAFRAAAMGISRYDGITKKVGGEIRWTGKVALVESALELPLKWKRPRRIFVNSMSDLFHESVPDEWIDRIVMTMLGAPRHTYQILTKRPERMRAFLSEAGVEQWRNLWWGVSVEDQATADERIPLLLQTPAAVRWVSYEPALGPVDFGCWIPGGLPFKGQHGILGRALNWIVVGGESGPGARPFDLAWARQTIAQGRAAAGVPVFVKQIGGRPRTAVEGLPGLIPLHTKDKKGGDMAEWPADLRVREYPN